MVLTKSFGLIFDMEGYPPPNLICQEIFMLRWLTTEDAHYFLKIFGTSPITGNRLNG